ncbi:MAG: sigma-70 family RNA polymerase sigma factor [Bacteroidetes bacterium]|nr:sigma-70 family RNA polymerase sigma factor [Bacteroidota bacterium]
MLTQSVIDDSTLIKDYLSGDNESMSILMSKYKPRIHKYILMIVKNDSVADDIFQELYIKIQKSIKSDKYIDNGKFLSWCLRIAHNLVIDYFRQKKQLNTLSADDDKQTNILYGKSLSEPNAEDNMINEQVRIDLRKLVEELPKEQREVIILRHYMGMSFKDIAQQTQVSINTALGRMRYALINLRKMINDRNINLELQTLS